MPPESKLSYIGVDPGTSGAIAYLAGNSVSLFDIPTVKAKRSRKTVREVDRGTLLATVQALATFGPSVAVIEKVGGMSRQAGVFNFGKVCGLIEMAFIASSIPVAEIAPGDWKARAKLIGKDKTASRKLASELYPHMQHMFARVCDDGRAEALLIAHFWRAAQC